MKDLHVHVAEGGIPKEGPSAGLAILAAIASAYYEVPLAQGFALTGEITLRGSVMAVGGIRDKALAAAAAGLTDVIIPKSNEGDLEGLRPEDIGGLRFHPVSDASEALELVLPGLMRKPLASGPAPHARSASPSAAPLSG
jgi:ATP-dependent Lon protease